MPYDFDFQESNENHTLARQESGDANGVVKGQYSFQTRDGLTRTVQYTADDENGFIATIVTNEPGVVSHESAGATYTAQ